MKHIIILLCSLFLLFFFSCSNVQKDYSEVIEINPQRVFEGERVHSFFSAGEMLVPQSSLKPIAIYFGWGCSNEKIVEITDILKNRYGISEENGFLQTLVYPKDSLRRIKPLKLAALFLVGSPENTHRILAQFQDEYEDFPVFSFFSQDDILGTEAGSTAVIDKMLKKDYLMEEVQAGEENFYTVLLPFIEGVLKGWSSFDRDFYLYVSDEILKRTGYTLIQYVDPVTDIKSENHFCLFAE